MAAVTHQSNYFYRTTRLKPVPLLITRLIKVAIRLICRVDAAELARVPQQGPLIIIVNHVNFLEVPLLYTHLYPRDIIGMAKKETWNNPILAYLAKIWGAIPLDRQHNDFPAMRQALQVLAEGRILIVAPEGTRSGDGRLQQGHGGVVQLALRSKAPILALAHSGGENFWPRLRQLRRTKFHITVGQPFRLRPGLGNTKQLREDQAAAVMRQLAVLLPAWQRGVYAEVQPASDQQLLELVV